MKNDALNELILAINESNNEVVKNIINNGADLNLRNSDGDTALMSAIYNYNNKITEILINSGADINLQAYDGANAFSYAIDGEKIVDKLVSLQLLMAGSDIIDSNKPDYITLFEGNLENWNNAHTAIVANDLDFIKSARNRDLNKSPLLINYLHLILL